MLYLWVCVMLVALCFEAMTAASVAIWFLPSAAVSLALSYIPGFPEWAQFLVFAILSLLLIIFVRPMLRRPAPKNADEIIGARVVVVEKVCNAAGCGQVSVVGSEESWSARAICDEDEYEEGESLTVVAVEGVTLICRGK